MARSTESVVPRRAGASMACALAMAAGAALLLAGCSSESDTASTPSMAASAPVNTLLPDDLAVPAEQAAQFADGEITLAEYQDAFASFRDCADEAGGSIVELDRDPLTGVIAYQSASELLPPGEASEAVENTCYQRYFVQTEIAFQLTDPAVVSGEDEQQMEIFDRSFRPCLDHIGIAVPEDLSFNDENWVRLLDAATQAIKSGECPPSLFDP